MSTQIIRAIIGKGFGDEGKGLATDYFCGIHPGSLVVKHNGGAQAGHTVECEGKRFVFHQLSAGSFHNADTFWADSYYPDLYKISEEAEEFRKICSFVPKIYCDPDTCVTLIDDVITNMLIELIRGDGRHGSCGMGINECDLRTKAGYGIKVSDLFSMDVSGAVRRISEIRKEYGLRRLDELGISGTALISGEMQELYDMLSSDTVVTGFADEILRNAEKYVTVCDDVEELFKRYEHIVFENGQGLLLDSENTEYAPHVTASRTGLYNPCRILSRYGLRLDEAVYVSRTYVTRHGAGKLPYECDKHDLGIISDDATNIPNPWQGSIRYARHGNINEFLEPVRNDITGHDKTEIKTKLFITHINETDNMIKMSGGDISVDEFCGCWEVRDVFDGFFLSSSCDGSPENVRVV